MMVDVVGEVTPTASHAEYYQTALARGTGYEDIDYLINEGKNDRADRNRPDFRPALIIQYVH